MQRIFVQKLGLKMSDLYFFCRCVWIPFLNKYLFPETTKLRESKNITKSVAEKTFKNGSFPLDLHKHLLT